MTLLHWADFWHDWEHAARFWSRPDPLLKYPLFAASHALPDIVTALSFAAVVPEGVAGCFADWNVTEVAPPSSTKLVHALLKWLHHLEE